MTRPSKAKTQFLDIVLAALGDEERAAKEVADLIGGVTTRSVSSSLSWLHYTNRVEKSVEVRVQNANGKGSNIVPKWRKATGAPKNRVPTKSEVRPVRVTEWPQSITAAFFGDPPYSRSALAQRMAAR